MNIKLNYTLILFLIVISCRAQKKKEIKKYSIKQLVVTEIANGKTITDSKTIYNALGQIIEEQNFNKEGVLKTVTKFKYNKNGDVIEELLFSDKSELTSKIEYKYNALNEKIEEWHSAPNGSLSKKEVFLYDAKGFKTERKTLDANSKVLEIKKYTYSK